MPYLEYGFQVNCFLKDNSYENSSLPFKEKKKKKKIRKKNFEMSSAEIHIQQAKSLLQQIQNDK